MSALSTSSSRGRGTVRDGARIGFQYHLPGNRLQAILTLLMVFTIDSADLIEICYRTDRGGV